MLFKSLVQQLILTQESQGSKGLRQWRINVHMNILNDDIQSYVFCRLPLVVESETFSQRC